MFQQIGTLVELTRAVPQAMGNLTFHSSLVRRLKQRRYLTVPALMLIWED